MVATVTTSQHIDVRKWTFDWLVLTIKDAVGPLLPVHVGKPEEGANDHPPAVWIYYNGDTYKEPDGGGNAVEPNALHSSKMVVEFRCYGNTYSQAQFIRDAMLTALHERRHGRYQATQGEVRDGGVGTLGVSIHFLATIESYVFRVKLPLTPASFGSYDANVEVEIETVTNTETLDE